MEDFILLPCILIEILSSLLLSCFHRKVRSFVFLTLRERRFAMNHSLSLLRSQFKLVSSDLSLFCAYNKQVSSAKCLLLAYFKENLRSFMYIRKRSGPSVEACGTPHEISSLEESHPLRETYCFLSDKNDFIRSLVLPRKS